ncbi:MAG: hypothetical protein A3F16_06445 [Deltaproteobacteria bacterium RIFCSPHIGHO2_12_FULL_43_9]|nr:MAG: hypothetical protein A3F16_06445 [Deltaproteobacteria bacterium RIFCSPHIGHO2_12_FULL_43_9]
MVRKTVLNFHRLLFILILLYASTPYASPASLMGLKTDLLFYDYKDSSAIHENMGTPTNWLFEAADSNKINKNHYLSLSELTDKFSPLIRKEFDEKRKEVNEGFRVRIILWEKKLPQSSKVKSTRLIPLYPRIANNLSILDDDEIDRHDIKLVRELSSVPLLDFVSKGTIDVELPTPIEEPHLYFLGVYVTRSDEVPDFSGNNRATSYWINTTTMKPAKDLTEYLLNRSKVNDLKLFVVVTDYLDFIMTKSSQETRATEERALIESVLKHLKPSPRENNRKTVFFTKNESGQIIKKLEVQTGDIAVRLGVDIIIAVGLGPIPPRFGNDASGIFNWDVTEVALQRLFLSGSSPRLTVEEMFLRGVDSELGNPFSNTFATYTKDSLLTEEMRQLRDPLKTIDLLGANFDDDPLNDPEIKYFNRLDSDHPSPYLLSLVDFINADLLRERVHYYPGTIFFSHAGIISVEENKTGEKEVWIYDAYPKTNQFPNGIRRVPFAEMFGQSHGAYGAILRLRDDLDLGPGISAFNIAQQATIRARSTLVESILFNPANKVYFDYEFDWQNPDFLGCSEFVWEIFGEGALKLGEKLNLIPNLSMMRIPTLFAQQIGQNVKFLLQISPQDLATSPFVTRIADFDSKMLDEEIALFSATGEPQDLSGIYDLLNPRTGHQVIKIY